MFAAACAAISCSSGPTGPVVGDEITLSATFSEIQSGITWAVWYYVKGKGAAPVRWSSSDTAVALVRPSEDANDAGLVTGRAPGTAWITVALQSDPAVRDSTLIRVYGQPETYDDPTSVILVKITDHETAAGIDPNAVRGTIDVYALHRVRADLVNNSAVEFVLAGEVACAVEATSELGTDVCTINTAQQVGGRPRFPNGATTLTLRVIGAGTRVTNSAQVTIAN